VIEPLAARPTWPSNTTTTSTASRKCDLPRHGIPLRARLEERRPPLARRRSLRTFKDLRLVDYLVTTNHIIAETITLTRKIGRENAARLGDQHHPGLSILQFLQSALNEDQPAVEVAGSTE
jgi:hypothetical protein